LTFSLEQLDRLTVAMSESQHTANTLTAEQQSDFIAALAGLPWEGLEAVSKWLIRFPDGNHIRQLAQANDTLRQLPPEYFMHVFGDHEQHTVDNIALLGSLPSSCSSTTRSAIILLRGPRPTEVSDCIKQIAHTIKPTLWALTGRIFKAMSQLNGPINTRLAPFIVNNLAVLNQMRPRVLTTLLQAAANPATSPEILDGKYTTAELMQFI
jgi:hypothetical protein